MPFSSLFPRKHKAGSHSVGSVSTSSIRVTPEPVVRENVFQPSTGAGRSTPISRRDPDLDYEADYIPETKEEAYQHINEIREEKGLDGTHSNTSDLENALKVYVASLRTQLKK